MVKSIYMIYYFGKSMDMVKMMEYSDSKSVCVLIEKLRSSGIKILLYLLKVGKANKNTIRIEAGMGVESVSGALFTLYKLGLIKDEPGKGTETIYSLTEKGKRLAEHLKAAQDLLESA
jgi:DNA-binding MarR family transcriptional regulator